MHHGIEQVAAPTASQSPHDELAAGLDEPNVTRSIHSDALPMRNKNGRSTSDSTRLFSDQGSSALCWGNEPRSQQTNTCEAGGKEGERWLWRHPWRWQL